MKKALMISTFYSLLYFISAVFYITIKTPKNFSYTDAFFIALIQFVIMFTLIKFLLKRL